MPDDVSHSHAPRSVELPPTTWWERLPRSLRAAAPILATALVVVAFRAGERLLDNGSIAQWAYLAGFLVVVGAALSISARQRQRYLGGPEQAQLFRQALRTGRVPAQAERDLWRTVLTRLSDTNRVWRRRQLIASVVPVGFVLLLGAAIAASGAPAHVTLGVGAAAIALTGVVATCQWLLRRTGRRVSGLLDRL